VASSVEHSDESLGFIKEGIISYSRRTVLRGVNYAVCCISLNIYGWSIENI
jgi:hypothetical protein